MKEGILFGADGDEVHGLDPLREEARAAQFGEVGAWYAANREKIKGGNQLAHPTTATTVRFSRGGKPLVTDGPFLEGDEVIGGLKGIQGESLGEGAGVVKAWAARRGGARP